MSGFFANMNDVVNDLLDTFVTTTSTNLTHTILPILVTAATIYFMCKAWSIMYGQGNGSVKELTIQCIKIVFISTIFCNTGNFYEFIRVPLSTLDTFFFDILPTTSTSIPKNAFGAIDWLYAHITGTLGNQLSAIFEKFADFSWRQMINAAVTIAILVISYIVLILCTVISMFTAFVILLTNSIALAFIIAFGPLFGSLAMFPQTREMFLSWLKACLNFAMTKVFIMAGIVLMSDIITSVLGLTTAAVGIGTDKAGNFKATADAFSMADSGIKGLLESAGSALIMHTFLLILVAVLLLSFSKFFAKCPSFATSIIGGLEMNAGQANDLTDHATKSVQNTMANGAIALGSGGLGKAAGIATKGLRNAAAGAAKGGHMRTYRLLKALSGSKPSAPSKS